MAIYVYKGDTFFTRSNSLLGRLIRWGEREKGEEAPWTNHAGVVVEEGWLGEPPTKGHREAIVVEALWHTRKGAWEGWKDGTDIRAFVPNPPYTEEELSHFVADANHYVGDHYGWWKLFGFLIKRATGINVPELFFIDSRPICSYLAAKVNNAARRKGEPIVYGYVDSIPPTVGTFEMPGAYKTVSRWPGFGMDPQAADPDEMMDFCLAHPEFWVER